MQAKFNPEGFNDFPYALAFGAQIIAVVLWIGASAGSGKYSTVEKAAAPGAARTSLLHASTSWQTVDVLDAPGGPVAQADPGALLVLLAFCAVMLATVFACAWLAALKIIPTEIVKAALLSVPVMSGILFGLMLATGQMLGALLAGIFFALSVLWVYWVWDRAEFTGKLFKSTSETYSKSNGIYFVTLVSVFAQVVWMIVWLLAVAPMGNGHGNALAFVLLLLSWYWTYQVITNTLYVSCGGVVARHYFSEQTEEAVAKSTKAACTNFFGSICFGSLIIAIIQTLKFLARQAQEQAAEDGDICGQIMGCIATCILSCIEDIMEFINAFAFAYIAIYGLSFCDAGKKVFELLSDSDGESLVSYSLVDTVTFFGCLSGGLFTCALTTLLAWRLGLAGGMIFGAAVIGFLCGIALMSVVAIIMEAGCNTLFVCYAESPQLLRQLDFELADEFAVRKGFSK